MTISEWDDWQPISSWPTFSAVAAATAMERAYLVADPDLDLEILAELLHPGAQLSIATWIGVPPITKREGVVGSYLWEKRDAWSDIDPLDMCVPAGLRSTVANDEIRVGVVELQSLSGTAVRDVSHVATAPSATIMWHDLTRMEELLGALGRIGSSEIFEEYSRGLLRLIIPLLRVGEGCLIVEDTWKGFEVEIFRRKLSMI